MTFGFALYNEAGALRLSMSHRLTRVLFQQHVGKDASGSASVDLNGATNPHAFSMVADSSGFMAIKAPHEVTLTGSLVQWTALDDETLRADSLVIVIAYE